jgi:large subunit ribosomal protein L29
MKLRELKALREKPVDELKALETEKSRALFQSRVKHGVGQLNDTSTLRQLRRDIARIQTELAVRASAAK